MTELISLQTKQRLRTSPVTMAFSERGLFLLGFIQTLKGKLFIGQIKNIDMTQIKGKFITWLKEGDYFTFDSMTWRIYNVLDEHTFTAWEESGEVTELTTFSVNVSSFEIIKSSL